MDGGFRRQRPLLRGFRAHGGGDRAAHAEWVGLVTVCGRRGWNGIRECNRYQRVLGVHAEPGHTQLGAFVSAGGGLERFLFTLSLRKHVLLRRVLRRGGERTLREAALASRRGGHSR